MQKKGDYVLTEYSGGTSSFKSNYGDTWTGYRLAIGELGAPTKPDTANQIQQVNSLLNQGIVPIEVGVLQPEAFDQIPKTHFKEINRMAKLTGSKISIHAPLFEPSGFSQQGWEESERETAEKKLREVVEKSFDLDDKGGVPITIHSSGIPGSEYEITPDGKRMKKMIVVNKETGKMAPLNRETKFYPGMDLKKGRENEPEKELESLNNSEWVNNLTNLQFYKKEADEVLNSATASLFPLLTKIKDNEDLEKYQSQLTPEQHAAINQLNKAQIFLENVETNFNAIFNKAAKYSENKRIKDVLNDISNDWKQFAEKVQDPEKREKEKIGVLNIPILKAQLLDKSLQKLHQTGVAPEMYVPIEKFATEKASETFSNVAFQAYEEAKKRKKIAPKISIENLYPGMAFAYGEDMKNLINSSREKFVQKALEKGLSKSEAEKKAQEIIGMTLDVGHLNIAKKQGFKDKDLRKEVEQIAKYVKHVHLTDNFGYSDSHLPPGMGNVPFKELLEELEKHPEAKEARKIVEAGGFVQHFGTSPYIPTLESFGSPIYADGVGPYWNQNIGLQQNYFGGYGMMLPEINYQSWGAGFSQLPAELGGSRGGGAQGSRMSGRPME
ncbi:TIM barrel protein [Candidatus Pacearchaeota archaeon]|nr:TIM barrel protein [Candidatus Pacearchaeota archaeon]